MAPQLIRVSSSAQTDFAAQIRTIFIQPNKYDFFIRQISRARFLRPHSANFIEENRSLSQRSFVIY